MTQAGTFMADMPYEALHAYIFIARGIMYGSCGGPQEEAVAMQHLLRAMKSGDVDPYLIFLVFLNDESVL